MARRIAVAVLALITALLAVVAIPLGLLTSAQARRDFQVETAAEGSALANAAEDLIDDGRGAALNRTVAYWQAQGDQVAVYDVSGRWVAGTRARGLAWRAARSRSSRPLSRRTATGRRTGPVPPTPIVPDSGSGAIGTVELARSSEPLDHPGR